MPSHKRSRWHRLRKPVVGLLVAAAHGALLVAIAVHTPIRPDQDLAQRREAMQLIEVTAVRTIPPPAAPSPVKVTAQKTSAVPGFVTRRSRAATPHQMQQMASATDHATATSTAADTPTEHAPEANTAVNTTNSVPPPLKLDPETMRKAAQQVKPSNKAIDLMPPNRPSGEHSRSGTVLAKGIAAAQHGDCMHGEYSGSGAGLLSAPFLAAAYVRGHCAR